MTHRVTVTTRLEYEGTPDETRVVDRVIFSPGSSDIRRGPVRCICDCETFHYENDADTTDQNDHPRIAGQHCLLGAWFEGDQAVYVGADYDDLHRDDYVPAIDRSGPITVTWADEYPEWEFIFPAVATLREADE